MSLLGPEFLVAKINIISLIISAIILVLFSDFFNQGVVFPLADLVRSKSNKGIKKIKNTKKVNLFAKYSSEGLATLIFVIYCYLGTYVLAEYIIAPVLRRTKNILLITLIALFFVLSYVINNKIIRDKLMKY
ncbi:hypothetical protein KY334_03250 [Candidatus Woesearchaeota archaeon]|nr:hypothetical protein [Candidatus Woesearchaeota archaeon]